jgi:hypothetical protein
MMGLREEFGGCEPSMWGRLRARSTGRSTCAQAPCCSSFCGWATTSEAASDRMVVLMVAISPGVLATDRKADCSRNGQGQKTDT